MSNVPVTGDYIHVPGSWLKQVGRDFPNRDTACRYGLDFRVAKREKYLTTMCGEDWRITLELAER